MKYKHIKNLWDVTKVVYKEKLIVFMKRSMVWKIQHC